MRMLLNVVIPHEPFNSYVRDGSADKLIARILDEAQPEAVYFTEQDGARGALLIVDVQRPSDIPALAEPWFLKFNADCKFRIVMTPGDLQKAELDTIGSRWK